MPAAARLPFASLEIESVPLKLHIEGSCVGHSDPDIFFSDDVQIQMEAKQICANCPAAAACHSYARQNEAHGVWGNTTAEERASSSGMASIVTPEERRDAEELRQAFLSGMTVAQIARKYKVAERTIYRYQARLRQVGFDVA